MKGVEQNYLYYCLIILSLYNWSCHREIKGIAKENMEQALLLEYTISGGMSPETFETMRIASDGQVQVFVGNGWPLGNKIEEVGIYEMTLSEKEINTLQTKLHRKEVKQADKSYGKFRPGTMRKKLKISQGKETKEINWPDGEVLPSFLKAMEKECRKYIIKSKDFPRQVIAYEVHLENNKIKQKAQLEGYLKVTNKGQVSCTLHNGKYGNVSLKYLIKPNGKTLGEEPPLIEIYGLGTTIDWLVNKKEITLNPEESFDFAFQIPTTQLKKGSYELFIMTESEIDANWNGLQESFYVLAILPQKKMEIED